MKRRGVFWALCLAAFTGMAGRVAAKPRVDLTQAFVLGAGFAPNQWATVSASVMNLAEEPADPTMVLTVSGGQGVRQVRYVRPVHVPAHCERSVWFRAQLPADAQCTVELMEAGQPPLASRALMAVAVPASRLMMLGMDDQGLLPATELPLALGAAGGEGAPRQPARRSAGGAVPALVKPGQKTPVLQSPGAGRRLAFSTIGLGEFPDHWSGLDSLGVVAIGHVDHTLWRPSQVAALTRWLESGGVLLLCPGADFEAWRGSPLEHLLPARMWGSRKQNWLVLEKDGARWEVRLDRYVDVVESEAADGEVMFQEGSLPMVVKRRCGMGVVYFLAFPGSALEGWKEREVFLAHILRSYERLKPLTQTVLLREGPRILDEVAGAQVAPPTFVAATLGSFFLLSALALFWFRRQGRAELAWAVIIPAGLLMALVSYGVGVSYSRKVGLSLNEMAVVSCASGSTVALRNGLLGVHSVQELTGQLSADDEDALFASSFGTAGAGGQVTRETFDLGPPLRLTDLSVPPGAFPYFLVDSLADLGGGVTAELELGEDGLSGVVKNNSPLTLHHCLFAANAYPLTAGQGSLRPGQSMKAELSERTVRRPGDFTTEDLLGSRSQTRRALIENLFTPAEGRPFVPWARRLFFLGWPEGTFISENLLTDSTGELRRRSISLLCVESVVRRAPAGRKVLIPRAFSIPMFRPSGSSVFLDLAAETTGFPLQMDLNFYLPDFASNVRIEEAELHLAAKAYGYDLSVFGRHPATGELTELQALRNPDGEAVVPVPDAGRFQDVLHNALTFEIRATMNPQGRALMGEETLPSDVGWTLREAAVTLRGTAQ